MVTWNTRTDHSTGNVAAYMRSDLPKLAVERVADGWAMVDRRTARVRRSRPFGDWQAAAENIERFAQGAASDPAQDEALRNRWGELLLIAQAVERAIDDGAELIGSNFPEAGCALIERVADKIRAQVNRRDAA